MNNVLNNTGERVISFPSKNEFLIGKSGYQEYLPLWMHLKDTAGIIEKLIEKWVSDSTIRSTGLSSGEFKESSCFLAAVHDIGKATSYFQYIITKNLPEKRRELNENGFHFCSNYMDNGETPHAYAGEEIFKEVLRTFNKNKVNEYASVIGAHHGKPAGEKIVSGYSVDYLDNYKVNIYGNGDMFLWESVWKCIISDALNIAGVNSFDELPEITMEAQTIISGLVIMADWLASNTYYFPLIKENENCDRCVYPKRVDEGWEKLEFPERWDPKLNNMGEGDFKKRFGFSPNLIQKSFIDIVNNASEPGLFILEAPMGCGKTEAALSASEILANKTGAEGVFFGLPTQATSNGLFPRLIEWAESVSEETVNAIRLAHSAAEFNEDYKKYDFNGDAVLPDGGLEIHPWFNGNKKALLADFVVGTVDQFLLATLKRKHFMLRHLGLSGKIVIIDECHAYDAYMDEYLLKSLKWMAAYGVPVILLSATLPQSKRIEFTEAYSKAYIKYFRKENIKQRTELSGWKTSREYPLCTWTDGSHINQMAMKTTGNQLNVRFSYSDSIESLIGILQDKLSDGGCACLIMNTVKESQKLYGILKEQIKEARLILYHAQFISPDRTAKENELLNAMGKKSQEKDRNFTILVGTQVLEQSLDFDADIMVTQICPIDLLLQRVGRLHRHVRKRPEKLKQAECIIFSEDEDLYDKGTEKIYGEYLLTRSLNVLEEYKDNITIPQDVSEIVQKVYDESCFLGESEDSRREFNESLKTEKLKAGLYTLANPSVKSGKTLDGILNFEKNGDEEVAVRDGQRAVEVILMKYKESRIRGSVGLVDGSPDILAHTETIPDEFTAKIIAQQKIKLPAVFCSEYFMDKTIMELESRTKNVETWQASPWLKDDYVLILDENGWGELNSYRVSYSRDKGFAYTKFL